MAGQLINRGKNTWLIRVHLGRDGKGKRKYANKTVHGTKKEAQTVLNQMLLQKDTGRFVQDSRVTLGEYLDEWLRTAVKPRVRIGTHDGYAATLRRYVRPRLGAMRLQSVRPTDIQAIYNAMQDRGQAGSVRYTHTILKGALNQAVKWDYLHRNPAHYVDVPKARRGSPIRALSAQEVDQFLRAAATSRWHVLFHLLVSTGLRPSEALALRWRDVDLGQQTLSVRRSRAWIKAEKRFAFQPPKTPSSNRQVPLPHGLTELLGKHMEAQEPSGQDSLLFTTRKGNPPHQRPIVAEAFKPALRRAGLSKETRLYDLRHTHATLLLQAGVHPKVVSERLGHASVNMTLDVYSHVLPSMQTHAAEQLDAVLYANPQEGVDCLPN